MAIVRGDAGNNNLRKNWLNQWEDHSLYGTGARDEIYGYEGDDSLWGLDGNDHLDGGSGADFMNGGLGDDVYIVDNASDSVDDHVDLYDAQGNLVNAGYDTVRSSISYTLPSQIERLELLGGGNINGTGNGLANVIIGNSGVNVLDGGAGIDYLDGGANDDVLIGGMDNDTLFGGAGADQMFGNAGDDTYYVDNAGDVVSEFLGSGKDTVYVSNVASFTLAYGLEDMVLQVGALNGTGNEFTNVMHGNDSGNTLSGMAGADTLYGNGGDDDLRGGNDNDWLYGHAGRDNLNGQAGNDHMYGGINDDTYHVDSVGDVVFEWANEGIDTVNTSIDYTLPPDVENLNLGTATRGTGNNLVNEINGNLLDNTLDGRGGADIMRGGFGNDTYIVDNAGDQVVEGQNAGVDKVRTSVSYMLSAEVENLETTNANGTAAMNLYGNNLVNTITGNNGRNSIAGYLGNDTLTGGGGADTFHFNTALGSSNIDTITDFNVLDDTMNLENAVFTALGAAQPRSLTAAEFYRGSAAHDASDRVIYNSYTGALLYDADGNGAQAAIQFATLSTGLGVTESDFLVV